MEDGDGLGGDAVTASSLEIKFIVDLLVFFLVWKLVMSIPDIRLQATHRRTLTRMRPWTSPPSGTSRGRGRGCVQGSRSAPRPTAQDGDQRGHHLE